MSRLTAADGHGFYAYDTGPADAKRALVVVQEIFGVNRHMRHVADRLAGFGYRVLCPALFDRAEPHVELGYGPGDIERGRALRAQIPDAAVRADIEATARALGGRPTGIIGYCWGGSIAWMGATETTAFKAACGWYGAGIAARRDRVPHVPVQLHFGETDASIPLGDVEAIRQARPEVAVFVYAGAGHGFGCAERESYDPAACELAELRSLAFFAEHVR